MALQTKTITANGSKGHHVFTLIVNEDSTNIETNKSSGTYTFQISPISRKSSLRHSTTSTATGTARSMSYLARI